MNTRLLDSGMTKDEALLMLEDLIAEHSHDVEAYAVPPWWPNEAVTLAEWHLACASELYSAIEGAK